MIITAAATAVLLSYLASVVKFITAAKDFFQPESGHEGWRAVLFGTFLANVLAVLAGVVSWSAPPPWELLVLAVILLVSSNGLFRWAQRAFGKKRPAVVFARNAPDEVISHGPYRYMRHPFYFAYLLGLEAGAVLAQTLWVWPLFLLMCLIYMVAAIQENRLISGRQGLSKKKPGSGRRSLARRQRVQGRGSDRPRRRTVRSKTAEREFRNR